MAQCMAKYQVALRLTPEKNKSWCKSQISMEDGNKSHTLGHRIGLCKSRAVYGWTAKKSWKSQASIKTSRFLLQKNLKNRQQTFNLFISIRIPVESKLTALNHHLDDRFVKLLIKDLFSSCSDHIEDIHMAGKVLENSNWQFGYEHHTQRTSTSLNSSLIRPTQMLSSKLEMSNSM